MELKFKTLITLLLPYISFSQDMGLDEKIDNAFKPFADAFFDAIFFKIYESDTFSLPFVLVLLVGSALFFTVYFGFPNIRYFTKSLKVVSGKYDHLDEAFSNNIHSNESPNKKNNDKLNIESSNGEVSHFQALATAVSGTVGNGNIAGVALAIALGGPGATFWMVVCGLLGMSTKFVECTLGVQFRDLGKDGTVYGGPMYYISKGLKSKGLNRLGKLTAALFAVFCIGGSFGGGNAAQSNQATIVIKELFNWDSTAAGAIVGIVLAALVGVIIIGGIKRIAQFTEKVVPFMAIMYVAACLYIIISNFSLIDDAVSLIVKEAFNPTAFGIGSIIGVLIVGFQRAAFSNEAGAGSASIAHSAVRTKYSASEGLVALLEPFIDTVVICSMTALVIVIFNFSGFFEYGGDGSGVVFIDGQPFEGAGITSKAFAQYIPYSNVFLTIAVVLFAVSTMISWSYYGLQSWKFLFGRGKLADLIYKILFLFFVVIGAAASMSSIWKFSDAMIFAMIFPNMVGLFLLFPIVKKELEKYLNVIRKQ